LIQARPIDKYLSEIYPENIRQVHLHVLPLLEDGSRVLTVELVYPNFHFYKHIEEVRLTQPWILDNYLRQNINDTQHLIMWLKSERIKYIFIDRWLSGNPEFSLIMKLFSNSINSNEYSIIWDDGRFALLELRTQQSTGS
jgi:hypothetical protein